MEFNERPCYDIHKYSNLRKKNTHIYTDILTRLVAPIRYDSNVKGSC